MSFKITADQCFCRMMCASAVEISCVSSISPKTSHSTSMGIIEAADRTPTPSPEHRKRALLSDEQARHIFQLRIAATAQLSGTPASLFTARSILVSKVRLARDRSQEVGVEPREKERQGGREAGLEGEGEGESEGESGWECLSGGGREESREVGRQGGRETGMQGKVEGERKRGRE